MASSTIASGNPDVQQKAGGLPKVQPKKLKQDGTPSVGWSPTAWRNRSGK